jgi:hypothetical protein
LSKTTAKVEQESMNDIAEQDLELLDRYLDGDLDAREAAALQARLSSDVNLASELSRMREHREIRAQAFASMEPSDTEAQQLQWYIRGAINQEARKPAAAAAATTASIVWADRTRSLLGSLSRVAAVLLVGFVVGYGYRAQVPSGETIVKNERPITNGGGGASAVPAGNTDGVSPITTYIPLDNADGYEVALKDQFGNVVATRKFRTLQEARDFASDLDRWQQRGRQLQKNGVRLIGDDF